MRRYLVLAGILVSVLLGLGLFMQADTVVACSIPTPSPNAPTPIPYSFENHIADSDYIFVGTVISISETYSVYFVEAEIQVEQYFKGQDPNIVHVNGLAMETTCGGIAIGKSYIFFTTGDIDRVMENFYPIVYGSEWSQSGGVWYVSDENIERVIAITNQSTAPYPLPLDQQIRRAISNEKTIWTFVSVVLVGMITGVLAIIRMRYRPRKSKAKRNAA